MPRRDLLTPTHSLFVISASAPRPSIRHTRAGGYPLPRRDIFMIFHTPQKLQIKPLSSCGFFGPRPPLFVIPAQAGIHCPAGTSKTLSHTLSLFVISAHRPPHTLSYRHSRAGGYPLPRRDIIKSLPPKSFL